MSLWWLFDPLINQGILAHNAVNKLLGEKTAVFREDPNIEVLTSPADFADYKGRDF